MPTYTPPADTSSQLDTKRGQSGRINRNTGLFVDKNNAPLTQGTTAADLRSNTLGAAPSISSASLAPQPSFNLTPQKPATQASGFEAYLGSIATSSNERRKELDSQRNDIFDTLLNAPGENMLKDQFYRESVDPLKAELDDINQQILAEQHSTRRQIEELQKNHGGMSTAGLADISNEIQTKSIAKQADLAIIQMARQGRYDSAKAIADRAVNAMLEQQRLRLEALKFNYQENKELFTTQEQRLFETMQAERDRELDNEEFRLRAEFEQKIRQSDPLYQAQLRQANLSAQKTAQELAGGGSTGDAFVNQPGFKKLTAAQQTAATLVNNYRNSLQRYRDLYNQYVGPSGVLLAGVDAGLLQSAANSLLFDAAQAAGTGALQAADRDVVEKIVKNPTSPYGAFNAIFTGGKQGGLAGLNEQITKQDNILSSTYGLKNVAPQQTALQPGTTGTTASGLQYTIVEE